MKGDSLADILHNIFRRSRPHFSAEMPYYRTIIAIVRAASGRVNLRPNRIMPRHFPVMVKQVSIGNNIDIMRRHTLPRTHNLVVIPISHPGKINFLIPSQAVYQLKDRFLPFSQQHIIAVLSSLLIIHRGVKSAQHHQSLGIFPDEAGKLIAPLCLKGKNPNQHDIRVQHVIPPNF